ncbi:MAG: hypothetical protein V4597_17630 [Pseudomonadota bacterium]|jgi:hypothetical protein
MSSPDDEPTPPRAQVPALVWAGLAVIAVFLFLVVLRMLNPPTMGATPSIPDIPVPSAAKPAASAPP